MRAMPNGPSKFDRSSRSKMTRKHGPSAPSKRDPLSEIVDFEFVPPKNSREDKQLGAKITISLKKLREVQAGAIEGKRTLAEVEEAATKAFRMQAQAGDNYLVSRQKGSADVRLARLRFEVALGKLKEVTLGFWDGTQTLNEFDSALCGVLRVVAGADADLTVGKWRGLKAQKTKILINERERREQEKQREDARERLELERMGRQLATVVRDKKLSQREKIEIEEKLQLATLHRAVESGQRKAKVAAQNANDLAVRAKLGEASVKQFEAALKAESEASRELSEASKRLRVYQQVRQTMQEVELDIALREEREAIAKRLRGLGTSTLFEWRLVVQKSYGVWKILCVVKVKVSSGGKILAEPSILHRLIADRFGPDSFGESEPLPILDMMPTLDQKRANRDLQKLSKLIEDGTPVGDLESKLANVLLQAYFQQDQRLQLEIKSELEEILKAFDKPVLPNELLRYPARIAK
jgi:hypothetical protein